MARRSYMFTNKKHSTTGIMSTVFGIMSLCTYLLCIYKSYLGAGVDSIRLGVAAFFATVFMITGFILGVFASQEDESFTLFKVLGILFNVLALLSLSAILYAGAYV